MTLPTHPLASPRKHAGPPLGWLAVVYMSLFLVGLYPVTIFGGKPYFPPPSAPSDAIVTFFQSRASAVLLSAFLQFGAAIPLGNSVWMQPDAKSQNSPLDLPSSCLPIHRAIAPDKRHYRRLAST